MDSRIFLICTIISINTNMINAGAPVSEFQKKQFSEALEYFRSTTSGFEGNSGQRKFLERFKSVTTRYCNDFFQYPGMSTEYKEQVNAEALKAFRKRSPSLYNGESGRKRFRQKWDNLVMEYCNDEQDNRMEQAEKDPDYQSEEVDQIDPAPPVFKKPLIITIHYLIKRQESATSSFEFKDHTNTIALGSNKFTVKQLADLITLKKQQRINSVQRANRKETYVFHDQMQEVQALYIGGRDKPIYAKARPNSGSSNDIRDWTKAEHIHVYNYKPTDPGIQSIVVKYTGRLVYYMYPALEEGKKTIGVNEVEYSPTMRMGEMVKLMSEDEGQSPKWKGYPNNFEVDVIYYQNGRVFFTKGRQESIRLGQQIARGEYKDANPILLFNFDPTKKLPYH